jgi:two-component system, NarL family, response regulator LiaR
MQKIKILFADDHAIVRDGLRSLFKSDPGFSIVGEAADGAEAVKLVAKWRPDVAVLDISMPNVNGIEATAMIKENYPETKVLILTIHENEEYIRELILAGADGYVLKNAEKKEIFDGVRTVAAGSTFFSASVSKALLEGLVRSTRNRVPFQLTNEAKLTKRETEVLRLIAEGMTSKQIAERLSLSVTTVNSHRTNMMKKLNIHEIVGLVKYAIQKSLIDLSSKR